MKISINEMVTPTLIKAVWEKAIMKENGSKTIPIILLTRKTIKMYVSVASFALKTQPAKLSKRYLAVYKMNKNKAAYTKLISNGTLDRL